ncbi:hypothetical protein BKA62DRAFT_707455 [Auriculariales sp. MPI-PUGE-AT-0066]|nr:hypothetical protein BKA62DRAFT_707455 [Auriculariales sp. MPI-PUGE-AT-0066]
MQSPYNNNLNSHELSHRTILTPAMSVHTLPPLSTTGPRPHPVSPSLPPGTMHPATHVTAAAQDQVIASLRSQIRELQLQLGQVCIAPAMLHALARPNDLQRRADARTVFFRRNNRNGNRMCEWCDTRRERRKYKPYTAPSDMMNCGCSIEEAKFEETLANNGVGSLETGQNIARMSPTIRAALLNLLRARYGYVDGDFDFHSYGGRWAKGDTAADWEARAEDED